MRLADADIAPYEGLVITTASMYHERAHGLDFEDVAQELRITVAKALVNYDRAKARQRVERYVFQCVTNRVVDLTSRRAPIPTVSIEDEAPLDEGNVRRDRFEGRYLSVHQEIVYVSVEDEPIPVPSTLTALEVEILVLMLRDYNQTQVAAEMGMRRERVRDLQRSIRSKMADWQPSRDQHPARAIPAPQVVGPVSAATAADARQ